MNHGSGVEEPISGTASESAESGNRTGIVKFVAQGCCSNCLSLSLSLSLSLQSPLSLFSRFIPLFPLSTFSLSLLSVRPFPSLSLWLSPWCWFSFPRFPQLSLSKVPKSVCLSVCLSVPHSSGINGCGCACQCTSHLPELFSVTSATPTSLEHHTGKTLRKLPFPKPLVDLGVLQLHGVSNESLPVNVAEHHVRTQLNKSRKWSQTCLRWLWNILTSGEAPKISIWAAIYASLHNRNSGCLPAEGRASWPGVLLDSARTVVKNEGRKEPGVWSSI